MTEQEIINGLKSEFINDPMDELFREIINLEGGDLWDGLSSVGHRRKTAAATQVFLEKLKAQEQQLELYKEWNRRDVQLIARLQKELKELKQSHENQ